MIPDGYTITGVFRGESNLYPEARVTYRPMLYEDNEALLDKTASLESKERTKAVFEFLASRITSIEANSLAGQPLQAATVDELRTLPPRLWGRIQGAIMGSIAPDEIVGETEEPTKHFVEEQQGNSPAA